MITGSSQRKWRRYRSDPVHPHKQLQYIPTSFEFPQGDISWSYYWSIPRRMISSYAEKSFSWVPPWSVTVTSRILCTQLQFSLSRSMPAFHANVPCCSPFKISTGPSFHWWHSYSWINADVPALWRRKIHLRSILMMLVGGALVLGDSRGILSRLLIIDVAPKEDPCTQWFLPSLMMDWQTNLKPPSVISGCKNSPPGNFQWLRSQFRTLFLKALHTRSFPNFNDNEFETRQ